MTLTKIDHKFTYPSLDYNATPNIQPCIKLAFFSKLPHVSYEQFYGHWNTVHADLTVAAKAFASLKIQRYVQISQTPEMKAMAKELEGIKMLEFDGCSEIYVKDWQDWINFSGSEEYKRVMGPDCAHFMEMPISVYVGRENIIFGKSVEEGGTDGLVGKDVEGWNKSEG